MMDHRGTRSRWADDRVCVALFKDTDEMLCDLPRLVAITGVESRLRATCLALIKLNLTPNAPQHLDTAHADAGPKLVDETRDEERSSQGVCRGGPPWPPHRLFGQRGVATEGHPYD